MTTIYGRILLAGIGSALLLFGAFAFQYLGGLAPCPMCIWQRWPHGLAIVVALVAMTLMWRRRRGLAMLGTALMVTSTALGTYHAGAEQSWWEGPSTCTSGDITGLTTEELMAKIMDAPLVRCDEIVWDFLGISMAGWNAIISLGLAGLWLGAVVWWRNPYDSNSASQ